MTWESFWAGFLPPLIGFIALIVGASGFVIRAYLTDARATVKNEREAAARERQVWADSQTQQAKLNTELIMNLMQDSRGLKFEVDALRVDLRKSEDEVSKLHTENRDQNDTIVIVKGNNDELMKRIATQELEINALKGTLAQKDKELQQEHMERRNVAVKLAEVEQQRDRLRADMEAEITALREKIAELEARVTQTEKRSTDELTAVTPEDAHE